jgi:hypothetical protein
MLCRISPSNSFMPGTVGTHLRLRGPVVTSTAIKLLRSWSGFIPHLDDPFDRACWSHALDLVDRHCKMAMFLGTRNGQRRIVSSRRLPRPYCVRERLYSCQHDGW